MRTVKILALCGFMALFLLSCSSVMPNPEVEITGSDPAALTGTNKITITFVCKNNIDAIVNHVKYVCQGATSQTFNQTVYLYVPAKGKAELIMEWDATGLDALRAAIGTTPDPDNDRTMTMTFTGTDAYGYNKTFTVREYKISF